MVYWNRLRLIIVVLFFYCSGLQSSSAKGVLTLDKASATIVVNASERTQRDVKLPYRWDKEAPQHGGSASFILALPELSDSEPLALLFFRVGNQAEITLSLGEKRFVLSKLGELGHSASDSSKSPVWVPIPSGLLSQNPGQPRFLEVKISAQASRYGGLSKVMVGPATELRPLFEQQYRWRQTSNVVIVLSLCLIGLVAAGLWWLQRDRMFGLFFITAALGALRMADRILPIPPLPWPSWGVVTAVAFAGHILFMAQFCIEVSKRGLAYLPRLFHAWFAISALMALLAFGMPMPALWTITLASLIVPGSIAVWSLITAARTNAKREIWLLLFASVLVVGTGIRDFIAVRVAAQSELTYSLLPNSLFIFILVMGWIIVERYASQVRQVNTLNATLEQRVAKREAQLDESYQTQKKQDAESAVMQERARLMRDIHDGVGAQLVGLLSIVKGSKKTPNDSSINPQAEEIEKMAGGALDELRMAVDAMQPVDGDLATVLATLRYRLQPRLSAAGITVEWDVEPLPSIDNLSPKTVLEVQRILLEAFTNVIRHAKASRVIVSGRYLAGLNGAAPRISLMVEDDGNGFSKDSASSGKGLTNMRQRAQIIGANLSIEPRPVQGTRVRLEWAL